VQYHENLYKQPRGSGKQILKLTLHGVIFRFWLVSYEICTSTHWVGCWVYPRTGLAIVLKRKIPLSAGNGFSTWPLCGDTNLIVKFEAACFSGRLVLAKQTMWHHIPNYLDTHYSENLKCYQFLMTIAVYNIVSFVDTMQPWCEFLCSLK
jgi:hypothetical protein